MPRPLTASRTVTDNHVTLSSPSSVLSFLPLPDLPWRVPANTLTDHPKSQLSLNPPFSLLSSLCLGYLDFACIREEVNVLKTSCPWAHRRAGRKTRKNTQQADLCVNFASGPDVSSYQRKFGHVSLTRLGPATGKQSNHSRFWRSGAGHLFMSIIPLPLEGTIRASMLLNVMNCFYLCTQSRSVSSWG